MTMRKQLTSAARNRTLGVSLLELVIYIGIMTVVLLSISQLTVEILRGQRRASEVQRSHQSVRRAVSLLQHDLRYARSIDAAPSVFGSVNSVLVLQSADGSIIQYNRSGEILMRRVGSNPEQAVTTNLIAVEGFTVEYASHAAKNLHSVRITLGIRAGLNAQGQAVRNNYSTSITLR